MAALMVLSAAVVAAPRAEARVLKLTRLEPRQTARLSREGREQYEAALVAIDRILYEKALPLLEKTVDYDTENVHLHFMVVQLATYLGDTRWGSDSIRYYDTAVTHLRAMALSPRLNLREQQRAQQAIERLNALQRSVTERDETRRRWGREIAKLFREEIARGARDRTRNEAPTDLERRRQLLELTGEGGQSANAGSGQIEVTGAASAVQSRIDASTGAGSGRLNTDF
jgi:hypothetical protein